MAACSYAVERLLTAAYAALLCHHIWGGKMQLYVSIYGRQQRCFAKQCVGAQVPLSEVKSVATCTCSAGFYGLSARANKVERQVPPSLSLRQQHPQGSHP